MGFLQLLIGRDKYSISASTAGDEPLNPEQWTALIMPICTKTLVSVFAGLRATPESVKSTGTRAFRRLWSLATVITRIFACEQKA